jgi:uncharacterized protein YjbJ (UPF0337 family)
LVAGVVGRLQRPLLCDNALQTYALPPHAPERRGHQPPSNLAEKRVLRLRLSHRMIVEAHDRGNCVAKTGACDMNSTTLKGEGQDLGGNVKETVGKATGDESLQGKGIADQITGNAKQIAGAAKDVIGNPGPAVEKAKGFAQARPFATAALVGVIGLAVLNTLRGK